MEIKRKPKIRFLNDMKTVIYDQKWLKTAGNFPVYYMYRRIKEWGELRYDVTRIKAKILGREFPKTKGHEHFENFQEVYKVLIGKAIFLFQKYKNKKIEDVYAIRAKAGNVVVVPSYYGHVTINPSKTDLKMANWVSKKCKNSYALFEKLGGACYFYTQKGWIKNKNYKKIPKIRFEKPLKKVPKNLDFLKERA